MKIKHKYAEPVLIFLLVYIFNYLLFQCAEMLFIYCYNYLAETVPKAVPTVNPIHTPDEYGVYLKCAATVSAFVGLFFINYISLRLDNRKFEYIIAKTDGQYKIKNGISLYFSEFLKSDIIASASLVAPLIIGAYFIPEKLMDRGLIFIFRLGDSLIQFYGIFGAVFLGTLFSIITRIISVPLTLRTWRALWLSGSV